MLELRQNIDIVQIGILCRNIELKKNKHKKSNQMSDTLDTRISSILNFHFKRKKHNKSNHEKYTLIAYESNERSNLPLTYRVIDNVNLKDCLLSASFRTNS